MSNSHSNTLTTTTRYHIYRHIEKKKTWGGKSAFGIHEAMIELGTLQYV